MNSKHVKYFYTCLEKYNNSATVNVTLYERYFHVYVMHSFV